LKIGTENQNRKISTNLERFLILSKMAELSNEMENPKKKNCNKPRKILDFEKIGGIEQRIGKPKKNYNKQRKISKF